MKIYIMDTIELPNGSGGVTHKWELARNLSKMGHEVHVMAYEDTKVEGAVTHTMKTREKYGFEFFFKLIHLLSILRVIIVCNPDIIYTRNISFALLGLLIKRIKNAKLVLELNGISVLELNGLYSSSTISIQSSIHRKFEKKGFGMRIFKRIRMAITDYLEIFTAKKSGAVIAVTQRIKEILIKRGVDENKITVIPNGADVNLFRPISDVIAVNKLRNKYSINENTRVVMFVGSLAYWQGVEYLIQSAPLVLKAAPDTMFFIVGEGELKNELITLAKKIGVSDKCIFTGNVPYEKVPLYINMADVCIVPKKILGFGYSPLKLYEYMACGKPVVATKTAGFEILEKYNAGLLVNPENPEEFSNAIIKLLLNRKLGEQMGANGRELVVREYSWESAAKKTIEVFRTLLE